MEVTTKTNGIVNVSDDKILQFPNGILGFESQKQFALIDSEYEPFIWLQSTSDKNLAFLLIDPFLICDSYEADIDDEALRNIGATSPEDIVIMTIVTIPSDGSNITANFLGPIVINRKNNKCIQFILSDGKWSTKFDIVEAIKQRGE